MNPGSVQHAADLIAGLPEKSRPLAFHMLKVHALEHGLDPKKFLGMLAEVPSRILTDAYSGLALPYQEHRLDRQIHELEAGSGRVMKNGAVSISNVALPEDCAPATNGFDSLPNSQYIFGSYQQMLEMTREVSEAERPDLVAQARHEQERIKATYQLRAFLEHEYDPVKTTMGGLGGFFQSAAYTGTAIGTYAGVGSIPVAGPALAATTFVGSTINDRRTRYPDEKPENAIALGTTVAMAQMLILGQLGKAMIGDARAIGPWIRQIDATKPLLYQGAKRLMIEGGIKGTKAAGFGAAAAAVPLAVNVLATRFGLEVPGFDGWKEWNELKHPQPETLGVLATLWLTGVGISALRTGAVAQNYAQALRAGEQVKMNEVDARTFAESWAIATPAQRRAAAEQANQEVLEAKQRNGEQPAIAMPIFEKATSIEDYELKSPPYSVKDSQGNIVYSGSDYREANIAWEKQMAKEQPNLGLTDGSESPWQLSSGPFQWERVLNYPPTPKIERIREPDARDLGREISDEEVAALNGAPRHSQVRVIYRSGIQPIIDFEVYTPESSVQWRSLIRDSNGELVLKNAHLIKNEGIPSGYGIWVLAMQVRAARKFGVAKIITHAAGYIGDPIYKGYRVWPGYGFNATIPPPYYQIIPDALKKAKTFVKLYQLPGGYEWWKIHGGAIDLEFDLRDNSESIKMLKQRLKDEKYGDIDL